MFLAIIWRFFRRNLTQYFISDWIYLLGGLGVTVSFAPGNDASESVIDNSIYSNKLMNSERFVDKEPVPLSNQSSSYFKTSKQKLEIFVELSMLSLPGSQPTANTLPRGNSFMYKFGLWNSTYHYIYTALL